MSTILLHQKYLYVCVLPRYSASKKGFFKPFWKFPKNVNSTLFLLFPELWWNAVVIMVHGLNTPSSKPQFTSANFLLWWNPISHFVGINTIYFSHQVLLPPPPISLRGTTCAQYSSNLNVMNTKRCVFVSASYIKCSRCFKICHNDTILVKYSH